MGSHISGFLGYNVLHVYAKYQNVCTVTGPIRVMHS